MAYEDHHLSHSSQEEMALHHFHHFTTSTTTTDPHHHHHHHHPTASSVLRSSIHSPPDTPTSAAVAGNPPPPPSWLLNSSILRGPHHHPSQQQPDAAATSNFLHQLQASNDDVSHLDHSPTAAMSMVHKRLKDNHANNNNGSDHQAPAVMVNDEWEKDKCKAEILNHPLYDQLLSAHVSCLRIATPVDQLPRIDAQLAQSQHVVAKYSSVLRGHDPHQQALDDKDLDHFMTHYVLLLSSFKEQLQQHVRVHAMEAVMACWELEQSLQSLTGVAPSEGTGATMSDDDDDQADSDTNLFEGSLDGQDSMGFGPLTPTESERSLMERVRQELKHELKQGYKEKIVDIREEILRKRRAGKLPGDTTSLLKSWWQSHSKWPYPTEEDKARLVQETGLQLKQINNWFINQRKRNWHSNPSSSSSQKSKRKSSAGEKSSNEQFM
nr:homeobox protein knotted-1-like 11 isoform X1 [Coffea arabica]